MHGLISKSSICYWQDQPDYYLLFEACARPRLVRFLESSSSYFYSEDVPVLLASNWRPPIHPRLGRGFPRGSRWGRSAENRLLQSKPAGPTLLLSYQYHSDIHTTTLSFRTHSTADLADLRPLVFLKLILENKVLLGLSIRPGGFGFFFSEILLCSLSIRKKDPGTFALLPPFLVKMELQN